MVRCSAKQRAVTCEECTIVGHHCHIPQINLKKAGMDAHNWDDSV